MRAAYLANATEGAHKKKNQNTLAARFSKVPFSYVTYDLKYGTIAVMIQQYSSMAAASNDLHHTFEGGQNNNRVYFKIPRVVPNQKERFDNEEIFRQNAQKCEVTILNIMK